eukprot:3450025-Pyramimonas_sp.AAC.2
MRLILTKIGLDNVRLNLIKSVCDTRRECRVWDKPGHVVMPSTALPGKFSEEVDCDSTHRNIRYVRSSSVVSAMLLEGRSEKTMTSIL